MIEITSIGCEVNHAWHPPYRLAAAVITAFFNNVYASYNFISRMLISFNGKLWMVDKRPFPEIQYFPFYLRLLLWTHQESKHLRCEDHSQIPINSENE